MDIVVGGRLRCVPGGKAEGEFRCCRDGNAGRIRRESIRLIAGFFLAMMCVLASVGCGISNNVEKQRTLISLNEDTSVYTVKIYSRMGLNIMGLSSIYFGKCLLGFRFIQQKIGEVYCS